MNSYNISLPFEKQTDWTLNLYYTLDNNCIPLLVKATIKEKIIEKIPINPQNNNKDNNKDNNNNKDNSNNLNKNLNNNNINPNQKVNNNNVNPNLNAYNNMNPNMNAYNAYNNINPNLNPYNNMNPNLNAYNNMKPNMNPYNNMNPNLNPYNNVNQNQNNYININKNINQQQFKEEIKEIETPIKAELLQINFGTPTDILKEYITRENNQNNEDVIIHRTISYKNSLEQYIYDTRGKIEENGELKGFFTDDEKKELIKKMDELMDWLYSDDKDLYNKNKLEEKSKDMKKIGDEIYRRYNE